MAAAADTSPGGEDDSEDLAAAVSAALQNDSQLRAAAGGSTSDSAAKDDDEPGVVHFPGAYQAFHRKPREARPAKAKLKPKGARQADACQWPAHPLQLTRLCLCVEPHVRRQPGELVHAGGPQQGSSSDSFEALGLAASLADHLEGARLRGQPGCVQLCCSRGDRPSNPSLACSHQLLGAHPCAEGGHPAPAGTLCRQGLG